VDDLYLAGHVEALRRGRPHAPRRVLDLDDVETRLRRDLRRVAPPAGPRARLAEGVDRALLALDQRRALRGFDRVLVASEQDRQALGGGPRLVLVPNGTTVPPRTLPAEASEPATILCLGTYGYEPNVDGLFAFLEGAWPQVRRAIPGARLLVVGRDMPERVRRLGGDPAIEVHPDVPDVAPFYRRAAISVVPLRVGGGTRLKILEAFALGRAVVSTKVGCEGLEIEPGVHLRVADAPGAFAEACIDLLRRPARRARLVAPARRRVEERYAWDAVRGRLTELAAALLAEAEPTPARARPSPAAPAGGRP
jgi:glycosyltransferase involved in cell wall biosynthesis